METLGRLESVNPRNVWEGEASHFTPWLAKPENLSLLAETLSLELELEAQEKSVGPFRADLLCKDLYSDDWVLIENQLERTDHKHLGQLMTYASGLKAVTIVWIATRFTEEHRATLDWLNQITDESFRFFGLELEAWRIGESRAAPKFNIVSQPNNWSKSVAFAAHAIEERELSETRQRQLDYWSRFHDALDRHNGVISGRRKPQPQPWMSYSVGKSGVSVNASMSRPNALIKAEIYLSGANAASNFEELRKSKSEIESRLGFELEWEELNGIDRRIAVGLEADADDQSDWNRQHDWLAKHTNALHQAFSKHISLLK